MGNVTVSVATLGELEVFTKLWPLQSLLHALIFQAQAKLPFIPEQHSYILKVRVEEMLYPSLLEDVLLGRVLLFLTGSCNHQPSPQAAIRWQ